MTPSRDPEEAHLARLDKERVLRAAVRFADEIGLESLSIRKLADVLGVGTMSLYYYFRSKSQLLASMLDAVYAEMARPLTGPDWQADVRATAVSARDVLLRHPWACGLISSSTVPSPARLLWMNDLLGRLRVAGFSPAMTHHAYHALDSHIVGFVLWVLPYLALAKEQPALAAEFLQRLALADLPHLAEHIEQHQGDEPGDASEFEFGLELILEGLERRRDVIQRPL